MRMATTFGLFSRFLAGTVSLWVLAVNADERRPTEWELKSPRPEIGVAGKLGPEGELMLISSDREGLNGYWESIYPVSGGEWLEFSALRRCEKVKHPRRSCVVRIEWYGENGEAVESPHPINPAYFGSDKDRARPEFPRDKGFAVDDWILVSDRYLVPDQAVTAVVQLHLRWASGGMAEWKEISFAPSEALAERKVKLAAVHTRLNQTDRTSQGNREALAPLIAKAAAEGADLIVLPELLTCRGVGSDFVELAEAIPGPSTDYFGGLAKQHDCYIVAGLVERDGPLAYNVAVLIGPFGEVVGKYRKVTLPREEIAKGIAPGDEYPVFQTRFGTVGMMICYDVFFPEGARNLAMKGAEVIALPIWGGNPRLAAARCAENGIYLVTSTYTDHEANWMKTAIWDREGDWLTYAQEWDSVVVHEVDLNKPTFWGGLGDFQARIAREAPVHIDE